MNTLTRLTVFMLALAGLATPKSLCAIYIDNNPFNITRALSFLKGKHPIKNFTEVNDLCNPIDISPYLEQGYKIADNLTAIHHHEGQGEPNIVLLTSIANIKLLYRLSMDRDGELSHRWNITREKSSRFGFGTDTIEKKLVLTKRINSTAAVDLLEFHTYRLELTCSSSAIFSDYIISKGEFIYTYRGPDACPQYIEDYVSFLQRNLLFTILLLACSIIGVVVPSRFERVVFSLSAIQAAVMVSTGICVYLDSVQSRQQNQFWYLIGVFVASFVGFGFSYFARWIAVFFACISLGYSISWTILYIFTLTFHASIPGWLYFVLYTSVISIICCLSMKFRQFREKYAVMIHKSINNPFFISMTIAIFLDAYLDIVAYKSYKEFGRSDQIGFKQWIVLPIQLTLSAILIVYGCFKLRKQVFVRVSLGDYNNLRDSSYKGDSAQIKGGEPQYAKQPATVISM